MYLIAIAWLYVALMMAVAEATSTQGSVLGAVFTFLLYGLGPVSLVIYLLGTPARRAARRRAEQEADAQTPPSREDACAPAEASRPAILPPDGSGHPAGDPIASEREKA